MLTNLKDILTEAERTGYAVPAFNVYNMETVMGVASAAEELRAPVIMQFYSRLATEGTSDYLAPVILRAAEKTCVPVCMHLDHGAGYEAAAIAAAFFQSLSVAQTVIKRFMPSDFAVLINSFKSVLISCKWICVSQNCIFIRLTSYHF